MTELKNILPISCFINAIIWDLGQGIGKYLAITCPSRVSSWPYLRPPSFKRSHFGLAPLCVCYCQPLCLPMYVFWISDIACFPKSVCTSYELCLILEL